MSGHRVYTLWAAIEDEPGSAWMIAAEDEPSWEGDPARCEAVFAEAKRRLGGGYTFREITLLVDYRFVDAAFRTPEVPTVVEMPGASA